MLQRLFLTLMIFSCIHLQAKPTWTGYYRCKFIVMGVHFEQIELREDSTFRYQTAGDLIFDYAEGTFTVSNDTITLTYFPEIARKQVHSLTPDTSKIGANIITELPERTRFVPKRLFLKINKLYHFDENGKLIKEAGDEHHKMKEYYLIKNKWGWINLNTPPYH